MFDPAALGKAIQSGTFMLLSLLALIKGWGWGNPRVRELSLLWGANFGDSKNGTGIKLGEKIVIQRENRCKKDRKLPNIVLRNRLHNIFCTCHLCLLMLQSITNEVNFNISLECVGSSEHCLGTVNRYTAKERQKYHAPNVTQFAEQINYFTQNKNTSTTKINLRSLPTSDSRWFLMISPSSKWPDITAT